jgi:hypothetical protein
MIFGKKIEKPEQIDPVTQKGVDKLEKTTAQMQTMTKDAVEKQAPEIVDIDPQIRWSKAEIAEYDAPIIRPSRSFAPRSRSEPKEAKERARGWELVKCVVENNEVIGEAPEFWLDKFKGDPTYFWQIPANVPVYIPRFVAEHLSTRKYHVFKMRDESSMRSVGDSGMIVTETRQRLNCRLAGFGI